MATAIQANRVQAAADRYRAGFAAQPVEVAEAEGCRINDLAPPMAWAFREWSAKAAELGVITGDEAQTVADAIERGTWAASADLATRCAVTQLMGELLKAGA